MSLYLPLSNNFPNNPLTEPVKTIISFPIFKRSSILQWGKFKLSLSKKDFDATLLHNQLKSSGVRFMSRTTVFGVYDNTTKFCNW